MLLGELTIRFGEFLVVYVALLGVMAGSMKLKVSYKKVLENLTRIISFQEIVLRQWKDLVVIVWIHV